MQSYKGRTVEPGQRVRVYRNVRRRYGQFSIIDAATGLVLGHSPVVLLANAEYHVSEAGRQRVLRSGKKNVHAWVEGQFVSTDQRTVMLPEDQWGIGYYNPRGVRYNDGFYDMGTENRLTGIYPQVWCENGGTAFQRTE